LIEGRIQGSEDASAFGGDALVLVGVGEARAGVTNRLLREGCSQLQTIGEMQVHLDEQDFEFGCQRVSRFSVLFSALL